MTAICPQSLGQTTTHGTDLRRPSVSSTPETQLTLRPGLQLGAPLARPDMPPTLCSDFPVGRDGVAEAGRRERRERVQSRGSGHGWRDMGTGVGAAGRPTGTPALTPHPILCQLPAGNGQCRGTTSHCGLVALLVTGAASNVRAPSPSLERGRGGGGLLPSPLCRVWPAAGPPSADQRT